MHVSVPVKQPRPLGEMIPQEPPAGLNALPAEPNAHRSVTWWMDRVLFVTAILLAAAALWRLQIAVRWNLASSHDLVFESPNLATINALREGVNIYDPSFFNAPPFIFTLYPPLYHLVCAALPASATNPFLTGRIVAVAFMGLTCLGLAFAVRPRNWTMILLGIGLLGLLHPVSANAAFLKNDVMGIFFSLLALTSLASAPTHSRLAGAAFCCVLALAAKQVFVAAPAACFLFLLARQPRRPAFLFGCYYLLFVGIGAVLAQNTWGNGFWFCVLRAPQMPFDRAQFVAQWELMLRQPAFLLLNALVIVAVGTRLRRTAKELVGNLFFLYFVLAEAVLLATIGKPGSSTNYFVEPSLAEVLLLLSLGPSLLVGPRTHWNARGTLAPPDARRRSLLAVNLSKGLLAAVCLSAALWELASAKPRDFAFADPNFADWRAQLHQRLVVSAQTLPRATETLRVLNLATASTFYDWPGKTSINDPYLYSLLWERGVLPSEPMVRALHSQIYDLVVFRKDGIWTRTDLTGGGRTILQAVQENYGPVRSQDGFDYWTPKANR